MKILFVTRHYLDEMLGGPNCSKAFIRAIAEINPDTTLVYPEHNGYKSKLPFLKECVNLHFEPVYDNRSKWHKCLDMYYGRLHRFGPFVKKYLSSHSFDVIFIDHSFTASSGVLESALKTGAKVITLHHNVESQYIKDNQPSILYRIPNNYFALKAERESILHSYLNLTLTDNDKATFIEKYPDCKQSFHTIGTFEYEDYKQCNISTCNELLFVISGSMSAQQTESAVLLFLKEYMPVLNSVCTNAKLLITGRNPSQEIVTAASAYKNISIVPNPDNLTAEVIKGNFYICPLHTGGGLKLRCMDALRVGLPILAHKVSTRGYESIIADGYMFPYSTKEEFANGLRRIVKLDHCHEDVAKSFVSHFSFSAGKQRFEQLFQTYLK